MTDFPNSVYSPREKENRSGVVYDPTKKTVLFVDDINKLDDEVVSIETALLAGTALPSGVLTNGLIKSQRVNSADHFFEGLKIGDSFYRFFIDAYGSICFGGKGSEAPFHKFSKDSQNPEFLNYQNIKGPLSIFIIDSDTYADTEDAEATLTLRVKRAGNSEFLDIFNNHYTSSGDVLFGILLQKIQSGSYRDFLFGYYDSADTDPTNQIKRAERFYKISPNCPAGATTSRVRGQLYFRPPNGDDVASAHVHLGAGVGGDVVGSAPLKIDSGPLLTTPEDGAIEKYSGGLFFSNSLGRFPLVEKYLYARVVGLTSGNSAGGNITQNINSLPAGILNSIFSKIIIESCVSFGSASETKTFTISITDGTNTVNLLSTGFTTTATNQGGKIIVNLLRESATTCSFDATMHIGQGLSSGALVRFNTVNFGSLPTLDFSQPLTISIVAASATASNVVIRNYEVNLT
ncbi:MAG: hypothetical protein WC310_05455 [Patescibacteria group bacterium]|jgi:hypothetical protein